MIKLTPTSSNLATAEYIHTAELVNSIKSFAISPGACCFAPCETPLPVFADLGNESESRNNDFSKFIFEVPDSATLECKLIRVSTGVEYDIIDTTYGVYADIGDIPARPLVWAFVLNWYKVADLIGFGQYQLNVVIKNSSSTEIFNQTTPCYELRPYTCESAQGTVRFEVTQSGYVVNGFDWSGITGLASFFKLQQLRLYGDIVKRPIDTVDNIIDNNRNSTQVQKGVYQEYDISLRFISGQTYDLLVKDLLLDSPVKVNVYDSFNSSEYNDTLMIHNETEVRELVNNKQDIITLQMEDYNKGTIKRH